MTTSPPSPEQQELIDARTLWATAKPKTYVVTVSSWSSWSAETECRWRVTEEQIALLDGDDMSYDDMRYCETQEIRTPYEAFEWIEGRIPNVRRYVQVDYDRRGIPDTLALVIPDLLDANSGWTMRVSED